MDLDPGSREHGRRPPRLRAAVGTRLVGAVLLGMTTLLVPKADPREHWAVPPRPNIVKIVYEAPDEPFDVIGAALRAVALAHHW